MKMTAIGATIGLVMVRPVPKIFDVMSVGLHVGEPRLFFIVPVAILVVAILATHARMWWATRFDPMSASRQE